MNLISLFSILALVSGSASAFAPVLTGELLFNGQLASLSVSGAPTVLEMRVKDEAAETGYLKDFIPMHMKIMHLVILKKDLSHIAHVHPYYDMGTGIFNMALNLPTGHPDNFQSVGALPSDGEYAVFAEAKSQQYGMKIWRYDHGTSSDGVTRPQNWRKKLVIDPATEDGRVVKYFNAFGASAEAGAQFRAELSQNAVPGCGGSLANFDMNFEELIDGEYIQSENMQPWLMMGGHAVLVRDTGNVNKEDYFHLHSEMPRSSVYNFNVFNRGNLPKDNYRLWIQIKNNGKVLTLPFTFEFIPTAGNPDAC